MPERAIFDNIPRRNHTSAHNLTTPLDPLFCQFGAITSRTSTFRSPDFSVYTARLFLDEAHDALDFQASRTPGGAGAPVPHGFFGFQDAILGIIVRIQEQRTGTALKMTFLDVAESLICLHQYVAEFRQENRVKTAMMNIYGSDGWQIAVGLILWRSYQSEGKWTLDVEDYRGEMRTAAFGTQK